MVLYVRWLQASQRDFFRLYDFLREVNPHAAKRRLQAINDAVKKLPENPRLGYRLENFADREVRSWLVGDYEIRYELTTDTIIILRIWHTREDR